jgi:hypothetical protein
MIVALLELNLKYAKQLPHLKEKWTVDSSSIRLKSNTPGNAPQNAQVQHFPVGGRAQPITHAHCELFNQF